MKSKTVFAVATALVMTVAMSGAASGQAETGKLKDLLLQALQAAQEGQCPADILSPTLRGACLQQMPAMGVQLKARGAIRSLEFLGTQSNPNGPIEVYLVTFDKGSMSWTINTAPDGKALVLWSGG